MISLGMQQISVVVPCHNDGAYLAEAIESVLKQTRPADEIIVVDDGSSDETGDVARRFAERVLYVLQSHRGIGSARNTGLRWARGPYIAFLDADDVWPASSLEIRMGHFEGRPDLDAVLGMTAEFLSPDFRAEGFGERIARGPVAARLAGAMLIRQSAFERIGEFDEALSVGEWIDWIARFGQAGLEIAASPELVLRRRIHAGNSSGRIPASWGDYLTVLRAALKRKPAASEPPR
jgi:glycosyltransferase involved in cell wall biosynthesis